MNKKSSKFKSNQQVEDAKQLADLIENTSEPFDSSKIKTFGELPLSSRTKLGLSQAGYVEPTDIQRVSLGYTLCSRDVLGAAKTGSGKTLAFIIPIVEKLYKLKWSQLDGLGGLIISPTRELAMQIFQVLRKVGKHHGLSAGLIIGGKDVKFEKDRVGRMNILVATPGRLLQHLDEVPDFDCSNVQILVLDEADRILDLGFKKTINAVIEHLPQQRQTLLFSATQTKTIRDLARLSLKDPEYVSVHEQAQKSTPDSLTQNYLTCEVFEKLDILFSFMKSHINCKILVFLSSCKQVRFVYEAFCKLQPGIVLMCLHGKQNQSKRSIMFEKFSHIKSAVMFCTDIASRGLDFPLVDWVVQVDCPEDVETYIHRVGRTARYNANGKALLFLLPSEEDGMMKLMEAKKIPIEKIAINPAKTRSVIPQLQGICAQSPDIKYLGEKAFICYLRSIWLNKNMKVFDVSNLPLEDYASSLGLPGTPQVKFVRKMKEQKNQSRTILAQDTVDIESDGDEEQEKIQVVDIPDTNFDDEDVSKPKSTQHIKIDRMFAKKNQSVLWSHMEKIKTREDDLLQATAVDEENEDLLTIARLDHDLDNVPTSAPGFYERPQSVRDKRRQAKPKVKIGDGNGSRVVFDEEGKPELVWKLETENDFMQQDDVFTKRQKYVETLSRVMQEADKEDKEVAKQKRREKKLLKKLKERGVNPDDDETVAEVRLPSSGEESEVVTKRKKKDVDEPVKKRRKLMTLKDEEVLALRLLNNE